MATKTEKKNKVTKNLEIAISQIEKAHGPGSIKKIDEIHPSRFGITLYK